MAERDRERCEQCGFDSDLYNRADTISSQAIIPAILAAAIEGLDDTTLATRAAPDAWSIGEYLDHVREVAFGNRFVIELARDQPGTDLGPAPEPVFEPEARTVDCPTALAAIEREFTLLQQLLGSLSNDEWDNPITVDDAPTPLGWFARHVLHDAFHHLVDIGRIRYAHGFGAPDQSGQVTHINVSHGGVPKRAVSQAAVDGRGLAGDLQGDRRHHGRPFQAICVWSGDVIRELAAEGHPIAAGNAGENLTIDGVDWASLRPGTQLTVGDLRLVVSAHAIPCAKNAQWFSDRDVTRINHDHAPGRSRLYAVPLTSGPCHVGDDVRVENG